MSGGTEQRTTEQRFTVDDRPAARDGAGRRPDDALVGPVQAILRRPALFALPAILLVGAAVAIGLLREPEYTAEAHVNVGRVDVPAFTLQGVVIGNATLASGYARLVDAPTVVGRAANRAKLSVDDARERLSASPIPNSTLIRVEGEGASGRKAKLLANGGAQALIEWVRRLTERQQASGVLQQYRAAQAFTDQRRRRFMNLAQRGASRARVREARLNYFTARLRSESLHNRYLSQEVAPAPQNLLQLVRPATTASSDRGSVLKQLIVGGLVAGLLLGAALALLSANRNRPRRERA